MALTRTQIVLKTTDGIAENFLTNTWHSIDSGAEGRSAFATALIEFYRGLNAELGNALAQNGHLIKQYDLADALPRVPVSEGFFNFSNAFAGSTLPAEVALCMSFQGAKVSGVSQARRRGRVYLGPFNVSASVSGRPSSQVLAQVQFFGQQLLDASNASSSWAWAVFSPRTAGAGPVVGENAVSIVDNGWVDNAFDTQRRRGPKPSSRLEFDTAP